MPLCTNFCLRRPPHDSYAHLHPVERHHLLRGVFRQRAYYEMCGQSLATEIVVPYPQHGSKRLIPAQVERDAIGQTQPGGFAHLLNNAHEIPREPFVPQCNGQCCVECDLHTITLCHHIAFERSRLDQQFIRRKRDDLSTEWECDWLSGANSPC